MLNSRILEIIADQFECQITDNSYKNWGVKEIEEFVKNIGMNVVTRTKWMVSKSQIENEIRKQLKLKIAMK